MHVHAMRARQFAAEEDDPDRGERRGLLSSSTSEESEGEGARSGYSMRTAYFRTSHRSPSTITGVDGELEMERSSAVLNTDRVVLSSALSISWPVYQHSKTPDAVGGRDGLMTL